MEKSERKLNPAHMVLSRASKLITSFMTPDTSIKQFTDLMGACFSIAHEFEEQNFHKYSEGDFAMASALATGLAETLSQALPVSFLTEEIINIPQDKLDYCCFFAIRSVLYGSIFSLPEDKTDYFPYVSILTARLALHVSSAFLVRGKSYKNDNKGQGNESTEKLKQITDLVTDVVNLTKINSKTLVNIAVLNTIQTYKEIIDVAPEFFLTNDRILYSLLEEGKIIEQAVEECSGQAAKIHFDGLKYLENKDNLAGAIDDPISFALKMSGNSLPRDRVSNPILLAALRPWMSSLYEKTDENEHVNLSRKYMQAILDAISVLIEAAMDAQKKSQIFMYHTTLDVINALATLPLNACCISHQTIDKLDELKTVVGIFVAENCPDSFPPGALKKNRNAPIPLVAVMEFWHKLKWFYIGVIDQADKNHVRKPVTLH